MSTVAKEWTESEIETIRQMKSKNATYKEIGLTLHKSPDQVRGKWRRLGAEPIESDCSKMIQEYDPVKLRACVFDIETTDFSAGGINAHLVCGCILPLDTDEITNIQIEFEDNRDDQRVLRETLDELTKYDIWIGHFITGFDINFLRSRAAYHRMDWQIGKRLIYDTYFAAKRCALKSERKSLAFLGDFFRLKNEKTSIYPVAWNMIDSPKRETFLDTRDHIIQHCNGDVRMNKKLFDALWPIDRSMTGLPTYKK